MLGRDDTLAVVKNLIDAGTPLVTLTGPPGVGKTTLARALADTYEVSFVELVGARDAHDVRRQLAMGLGCDPLEADVALPAVAVFDNAEHLVDELRAVLVRLRAARPELQVVVTSRVALRLADEFIVPVAPLDRRSAVALLVTRIQRRRGPGTSVDLAAAETLVETLDRLPLAIELAAWRCRVLGVADVLTHFERDPASLYQASASDDVRHRTLNATIAWSWKLLSREARLALSRLSVFRGAFKLAGVAVVLKCSEAEAATTLEELVDHSLVRRQDDGRFALLSTVRAFAASQLTDGDDARLAHGQHYCHLRPPTREDAADLAAVVERFGDEDDVSRAEPAIRAASLLCYLGVAYFKPGRSVAQLERLLSRHQDQLEAQLQARIRAGLALTETLLGRNRDAEAQARRALQVGAGIPLAESYGNYALSTVLMRLGRRDEALAAANEGWRIAAEGVDDLWAEVSVGRWLAFVWSACGRHQDARRQLDVLQPRTEGSAAIVTAIHSLTDSLCAIEAGDLERAREALDRAAPATADLTQYEALRCECEGLLSHVAGDPLGASNWYARGAEAAGQGYTQYPHDARARRAEALFEAGDRGAALTLLDRARRGVRQTDDVAAKTHVRIYEGLVACAGGPQSFAVDRACLPQLAATVCPGHGPALRRLEAALEERAVAGVLRVAHDGRWFELAGQRVSLGRRGTAQRVVVALARHAVTQPGEALATDRVFELGWPGEHIAVESARNRVRVMINSLRNGGLGVIQRVQAGYRVDPAVIVEIADR